MAELYRVARRVDDLDQPLVSAERPEQLRDAAQLLDWRVARVDPAAHSRLLGHRSDYPNPILKPLPHLLFGMRAAVCIRHLQGFIVVKRCGNCPAAYDLRLGPPDMRRHPVVAEDRYPSLADVAHGLDHVVNLPLTIRTAEHDVKIEMRRHVLQRCQAQTVALDHQPQLDEVVDCPFPAGIWQGWSVEQHVRGTVLRRESEILRAWCAELTESWTHLTPPMIDEHTNFATYTMES